MYRRHLFILLRITAMAFYWTVAHRFGNTALEPYFPFETEVVRKGYLSIQTCRVLWDDEHCSQDGTAEEFHPDSA
jgi:hypothetical protein